MEKVEVLMAIYKPDIKYLYKQLDSIKNQTYKNIELLIFDDCIDNRTDKNLILDRIEGKFPVRFLSNENYNLGYAKAFEKLVRESNAKYLAFSDQDDIWDATKIERCMRAIDKDQSLIVAHGKKVIDEQEHVKKKSKVISKKRASWTSGEDIAKYQMFRDFVAGNCMLVNGEFARKCIPFGNIAPHDTWIACCASIEGKISRIPLPLTSYRRHGNNVSGVLSGINNKNDYYENRVKKNYDMVIELLERYPEFKDRREVLNFSKARIQKNVIKLWKMREISPEKAYFEILLAITPGICFPILKSLISKI